MKTLYLVDFDGTICETDMGDLLVHQATGTWWHLQVEGMGQLNEEKLRLNYAPWNRMEIGAGDYAKLIHQNARPRAGFWEWYQRIDQDPEAELYVVSAGLFTYVEPCITSWTRGRINQDQIIAVPCLRKGDFAHVRPDLDDVLRFPERSGYAKGHVALDLKEKFPEHRVVVVGDGRSDMEMAAHADAVYARRYLADKLTELKKPFHPFESFFDIPPLT